MHALAPLGVASAELLNYVSREGLKVLLNHSGSENTLQHVIVKYYTAFRAGGELPECCMGAMGDDCAQ